MNKCNELPNRIALFCRNKNMGRITSIYLENHFEDFIQEKISEGHYINASEVIRAGLQLFEENENRIKVLNNAIQEGIESGIAENFNPAKQLKFIKARKKLTDYKTN